MAEEAPVFSVEEVERLMKRLLSGDIPLPIYPSPPIPEGLGYIPIRPSRRLIVLPCAENSAGAEIYRENKEKQDG